MWHLIEPEFHLNLSVLLVIGYGVFLGNHVEASLVWKSRSQVYLWKTSRMLHTVNYFQTESIRPCTDLCKQCGIFTRVRRDLHRNSMFELRFHAAHMLCALEVLVSSAVPSVFIGPIDDAQRVQYKLFSLVLLIRKKREQSLNRLVTKKTNST